MSLIAFLAIGVVAGLLARALYPGTRSMGATASMLVGVVGAFVGGVSSALIYSRADVLAVHPTGILFAAIGAIIALALAGLGGRRTSRG